MLRIVYRDATQFREQFRRNPFRFGMFHALNRAMSSRFDEREDWLRFKPAQYRTYRSAVIGGGKSKCDLRWARSPVTPKTTSGPNG